VRVDGGWYGFRVSGGRKWVVGSSHAANVARLAIFDPGTNIALSRQLDIHLFVLKVGFASEGLTYPDRRHSNFYRLRELYRVFIFNT